MLVVFVRIGIAGLRLGGILSNRQTSVNLSENVTVVIPGRAEGANPESRRLLWIHLWIPGSALRAAPE
jgi:hypothetical protein